ncbi:carbonic anhydrase 4-like [Sphaeramia orbicularis]|uniref:Carbonic anhydrase n=1 Tax=Sphaeramia orbicularis TaxID=375764 RepID=A0A673AJS8_9TELE|nr:carbonic anhydrase 4-like [Sphaeramia orbicularis]XP_029977964.1 carbonic anhydrase 4-like [Sphaeramia orbicularis]XP_029977965.1 carbonic anhydrase 4-like [Sphaeramia orbicularis]
MKVSKLGSDVRFSMKWLIVALAVCITASVVQGASQSVAWCYHAPTCNDTRWPIIAAQFCNGTRQSPINIKSANATVDGNLTAFTFFNFNSTTALTKIENTGKTVKVLLASGVGVEGGGLSERYDSLQFHLHWGNGTAIPGSEHTVDGKRYPMELHIVNLKSSYNGNTTAGIADPEGLAALGFFIEAMSGNETGQPASWKTLTSYLTNITREGDSVSVASGISLDDLLPGVDRTKYFRYLGSLTTPNCNEAVVWTVFKEPVKVSKDLIDLFSNTVRIGNSTSQLMINVFRNVQDGELPVRTSSGSRPCYSLGLIVLILVLCRS